MAEFLDIEGDRTFLDIFTYRGVKISKYSIYENESEILLLPGTVLKVIDQLDVGHGLNVIQMKEIPSLDEIKEALLDDEDAINFWLQKAKDQFEIPLEDFCQAVLKKNSLPIVKRRSEDLTYQQLESYQKYWSLWIFSGGDLNLLSLYAKNESIIPPSERFISVYRFGLLLTWFGQFKNFLNELFNSCLRGLLYDDSFTSATVISEFQTSPLVNNNFNDKWLIRCSPKRETPFVITYGKQPKAGSTFAIDPSHQRIVFNGATRTYRFQNLITKQVYTSDSINILTDIIKREYKFGEGIINTKLKILTNPDNILFTNYEDHSHLIQD